MRTGRREAFRWTRENIVYALELWHRRHLYAPTPSEWQRAGEDHPSRQTVLNVFGSWSAAIAAAGLRPRRRGEPRQPWFRRRCPKSGRFLSSAE